MRLLVLLIAISVTCVPLIGCWDLHEITEVAPLTGLGFDVGTRPGTIKLSAQITPPEAMAGGGGSPGGASLRVLTVEAATVTEALFLLLAHVRREPFLMHLGFLVFGEELARAGIGSIIGGLHGNITLRGSVPVLVAASSAEDVLHARSGVARAPGQDILELLSNMRRAPLGRVVTFYEVINTLSGLGGELALPILDLTPLRLEAADHQPADGTGQQGQQLMEVTIGRTALFVRDRWVHELDVFQTQTLTLLFGEVEEGTVSLTHPTAPGGAMALRFLRFRPQFSPEVTAQGHVYLEIKIDIAASLTEALVGYDLRRFGPQPVLTVLEEHVTAEVQELFALMQQLGSDSLGVGSMIYRRQPRIWSRLEPRWSEHYRQMTVRVQTKASLRDTSKIVRMFAVRRE